MGRSRTEREETWGHRFANLQRLAGRTDRSGDHAPALNDALEELNVATEELRQENAELLDSRRELEDANRRYRGLFNFAPDAYLETDAHGVIVEANRAASAMFGMRAESLAGKPFIVFIAESKRAEFQLQLGLIDPTEGRKDWSLLIHPLNEPAIPVSVTVAAEPGPEGGVARLRWSIRDERERARLEHAVAAERDRFIRMVEAMPAAFLSVDSEWRITYVNVAAEQMILHTREEVAGHVLWDIFPAAVNGPFDVLGQRVMARKHAEQFEVALGDDVWIEGRAYPIDDGVAATFQDISERKRAEGAALQLAAIVEGSGDAIFGQLPDGRVSSWNIAAEKLFGYSSDEMVGSTIDVLIPEDRIDETNEIVRRVTGGERVKQVETTRLRKDGTPVEVSLTVSPLKSADDRVLGSSSIARDITTRRRYEYAQEQVARDRNIFISRAAHELRSPLTAIIGIVLTLARSRDKMASEDIDESFRWLTSAVERLEMLIETLLDLSRLEQGEVVGQMLPVDLHDAISEAVQVAPPPQDVDLVVDVMKDLKVLADPIWLQQTVTNLLTNAYKYGGKNLRVVATMRSAGVELSVEDDGSGVPEEFVPALFEPFTRGDNRGGAAGSGLGLAIVKRALETFGASIHYEPREPNGSRFVIDLQRTG